MNWAEHNLVKNGDVVQVAAWQHFDWLKHGFSLRSADNMSAQFGDVAEAKQRIAATLGMDVSAWTAMQQVHGNHIEVADDESLFSNTDGLITNSKNKLLIVVVADCVPLLLVDPRTQTVAVAHAGRRGTDLGIATSIVNQMVKYGCLKEDIQVAIGPSIGPCCYTFDDAPLDLWSLNERQLRETGIQTIIRTDVCTKHTDYFFSHQGDPQGGRFAGAIGIM